MKTLSYHSVMNIAKCSKSTALEIIYHDLLETKKLYLYRGNNANATINWLTKNFAAKFTKGNDAPHGGVAGTFVTFTANEKLNNLIKLINDADADLIKQTKERKIKQQTAINNMVISESERVSFLEKTKDLSNKKARQIAHNFAGRKLGFYSNDGMQKFFDLKN
jgi:hypothetical protein